jgi:hypothetical protein
MANFRPYQNLDFAFVQLFEGLSKSWASSDLKEVRDLVSHAEYGEALDNLVAIGAQNGKGFSKDQLSRISDLCATMGLDPSSMLKRLQGTTGRARKSSAA